MTFPVRILADGTKCYSGPDCKRHGASPLSEAHVFDAKIKALTAEEPESDYDTFSREIIVTFPSARIDEAINKIDIANRKLAKAGAEDKFEYTIELSVKTNDEGMSVEMATLTLDKPVIKAEGWKFEAVHQFSGTGGVISYYSDKDNQVSADEINNMCEHCGSNRHREKVYWVKNENTQEQKQVGSSCLKAFLGVSPAGLWALTDDLKLSSLQESEDKTFFNSANYVYDPKALIMAALAASDNGENFISRAMASRENTPTATVVLDDFKTLSAVNDPETSRIADEVLNYTRSMDGSQSNYINNLKQALGSATSGGFIKRKHVPLAVSAIAAWKRGQEHEAVQQGWAVEKAAREALKATEKKSFLAPKGEKVANIKAKITRISHFESNYGYQSKQGTMVIMRSEDGHVIKWSTTADVDFASGDEIMINSATVKDNTIYQEDTYQTVLLRPKIESYKRTAAEEEE
jgi:hypothetical protein